MTRRKEGDEKDFNGHSKAPDDPHAFSNGKDPSDDICNISSESARVLTWPLNHTDEL